MIHLYASLRHYADHLWPIWLALPEELRGLAWSPRRSDWWSSPYTARTLPGPHEPVLVASWVDYRRVAPRPVVFVEHGAGQSYECDSRSAGDPSYSGGRLRDRVVLYVVPNELVAANCRREQPHVAVAVVGCPKLDPWHAMLAASDVPASLPGPSGDGNPDQGVGGAQPPEPSRGEAEPHPGDPCEGSAHGALAPGPRGATVPPAGPAERSAFPPHRPTASLRMARATGRTAALAHDAGWSSKAARWAHNPEVAGSSPAPATGNGLPFPSQRDSERPVIAFTFHWDCPLVPETRSAWPHYDRALPQLLTELDALGLDVLGHGHPRMWRTLARRWNQLGVAAVQELATVLDQADVLVADNTSALFEFASLGKPVVVLNAPWYRRDAHHGLRFWQHADVGVQVDGPELLVEAVCAALADPPVLAANRARVVEAVYPVRDGKAAQRAAQAVLELLTGG